jgi:tetratricopeptide (TPR) repeat protein
VIKSYRFRPILTGELKMSRQIFRRSSLFRIGFLILLTALFSFSATAQGEEKQNQPKETETEKCKGDAALCRKIEEATKQIGEGKKRGSEYYSFWYYERAELYLEKGDIAQALGDANRFLKETPGATGLMLRGKIYNRLARYDEALKDFDAVLKSNANNRAFYGRGFAYYHKREYDLALNDFKRAHELDSRLSAAYYYRALILTMRGKTLTSTENYAEATEVYKKAVEDFTSVIDIDLRKVNPKIYLLRARLYEALDEKEKAEADRKMYQELREKP